MPIGLLKDIAATCPVDTRLLGIDHGSKTLGLAVSDGGQGIATPLTTIKRTKFTQDILELKRYAEDYEIGGYILGYPLHLDGKQGARCQSVYHFAQEMAILPELFGEDPWIALWDERLSTASVEDFVDSTVDKKKTRRGAKESGLIDRLAAQLILQGALDYLAQSRS